MSRFGDFRQNVVLALQSQGADALTVVRDGIQEVINKITVLNGQWDGSKPGEYIRDLQALGRELQNLQKMELGLIQTMEEGTRARIDATAREERAAQQLAEAQRQAAGDVLRARIDATARAERAAEQAAEALKQADGEALRAKIDAIARGERAAEEAAARQKQADGEAMRARIEGYARAERAAEDMARTIRRGEIMALGERARAYAQAERQTDAWAASMKKLEASSEDVVRAARRREEAEKRAAEQSQRGARGVSQAVLEVSRGLEDFATGGFIGILNNIPGAIQGIGQAANMTGPAVATLTAGVSLFATAAYAAYQNWDLLMKAFGQETLTTALNRLDRLKDALKALEDRKVKTAFDYTDIDAMKKKVDELTEAQAAYQRLLKGVTKDEQESARRVQEAITEAGGGTVEDPAAARIVRAMQAVTPVTASDATRAQRERLAQAEEDLKAFAETGPVSQAMREKLENIRGEVQNQANLDRLNQQKAFEDIVARASLGRAPEIAHIRAMMEKQPGTFAIQGIGPGLLPGLMLAEPGRVREDKAQEAAVKRAKDEKDQQKDLAQEQEKLNRLEEEAQRNAAQARKQKSDAAQAESIWQNQQNDRIDRERKQAADAEARDARRAQRTPAQERHATEMAYGQQFQSTARGQGIPISGGQATLAGKDIARMVEQGVDLDAAADQALANLSALTDRQIRLQLRNAARWEQLNGMVNGAGMQLQMLEAQERRVRIVTPTNNVR